MGRGFSTAYRIVLVIFAAGALVMSIMSATSCAFVKYDHQYKGDGRMLQEGTDPAETEAPVTDSAGFDTTVPVDTTPVGDVSTDPVTDPEFGVIVPEIEETEVATPATAPETVVATPAAAPETVVATPATAPETVVETPVDTTVIVPEISGTGDETTAETDPSAAADSAMIDPVIEGGAAESFETAVPAAADPETVVDSSASPVTDPPAIGADLAAPVDTTVPSPTDTQIPDTMEDETLGVGEFPWAELNEEGSTGTTGTSEDTANAFGATGEASTASAAEEPVAQVTGDAGLFCDSEQKLTLTNLWGGTMSDFEAEIAAESDKNTSEELARNAIIAATVFGSFALFLLMIESIIGWSMCCEKWIIGSVSVMACVSQGVTFLFFNSERYCDGDIVHEILNQEPCVLGQGGIFSIVALVLYFIMVVMSCKLPQDDPYGLCCKNRNRGESAPTSSGSGKFGFLGGSKNDEKFKGSSAEDPRRERPGWLSEDANKKVEEGDEII